MSLLETLASENFLYEAWDSLNKYNTESHGLSGETILEFKGSINSKIPIISEKLKKGTYQFKSTRAYLIPKEKKGEWRPLQIPEIEDRVVSKAIAILLEEQLSSVLAYGENVSFAYQKGLGVKNAVERMVEYYRDGYCYIYEADIIKFFPSVDKQLLLGTVFKHLSDESINTLIQMAISQEVGGLSQLRKDLHHFFDDAQDGIPQGNPLSPLFSNFFLAPFDKRMTSKGFKLIRYADDFIVMCRDKEEAINAYNVSKNILENALKLKLHELSNNGKTRIVNPAIENFSFLSVAFNGKEIYPSIKAVSRFLRSVEKICHIKDNRHNVSKILVRLEKSLDGWISTYFYTNMERYLDEVDTVINKNLYIALNDLQWKLARTSLGKVSSKFRPTGAAGTLSSKECLSENQRKNSGIPFAKDILKERRSSIKQTENSRSDILRESNLLKRES